MPTLEEAGIGWRPPFVRADVINDRPFAILHAYVNPNGYQGQSELVAHVRFLGRDSGGDPIYDADGHELHECSWSASLTPQRQEIARYFTSNTEPLSPCQFEFRPGRRPGDSPFAAIVTYRGTLSATYLEAGGRDDAGRIAPSAAPPDRQSEPLHRGVGIPPLASSVGTAGASSVPPRRGSAADQAWRPLPPPTAGTARGGSVPAGSPSALVGRRPTDDDGRSAFRDDDGGGDPALPDDLPF